jgi:hypothetical protein
MADNTSADRDVGKVAAQRKHSGALAQKGCSGTQHRVAGCTCW